MKLLTLSDALQVDHKNVENWYRRGQLPVEVIRPGQGRAVIINDQDVEPLAMWLALANLLGPSRADVLFEIYGPHTDFVQTEVGCLRIKIDFGSVRAAILKAENSTRIQERAA